MSQQTLPCTLPPLITADGGFIIFVSLSSIPKIISLKENLCSSELFRLKDPKTWGYTIFTQTKIL